MKILIRTAFAALLLATGWQPTIAQSFTATYSFANIVSGSGGYSDATPVPTATGVNFGAFTAVPAGGNPFTMGANPNAGGRFSFVGWPTGATNGSDVFTGAINTNQYYQVTITPQAGYTLNITDINFTMQRSSTGVRQYAVRSSIDGYAANLAASINPANAVLSVLPDQTMQVTDTSTTAQIVSVITPGSNHTLVSTAVTLRFYGFNAEGAGGTFSIDNVVINGSSALSGGSPVLTLNAASINFPGTNIGTSSNAISYTLTGASLQGPVVLGTAAPFSISSDGINYSTSLNISASDAAATKTIYVKVLPALVQPYNGSITHNSTSASEKIMDLAAYGVDPANLSFNFNTCTVSGQPGGGFVQYNVSGAQIWTCTSFGYNGTNAVNLNGYSAGAQQNEDWLISPAFDLTTGYNIPVLRFYSRAEFGGPNMQVMVSTNYTGAGNPNSATWTALPANLSAAGSNAWAYTDNVDLSAYKTSGVYVAFKYTSSPVAGAARWSIDDVSISSTNKLLNITPAIIDFGEQSVGTNGTGRPITVVAKGFGNCNFTTTNGWQLSADNNIFSSGIIIPEATAAGTTIFARYSPIDKKLRDSAILKLVATGFDDTVSVFYGSSYPKNETLDVATWNMMFFGSNSSNTATQPFKHQQKLNAKTVFEKLDADVVGIQEISSDSLLTQLVSEMPGYASVTSPRYSYSFYGPDPNFPPQKVGFVYKTSTLTLVETRVMFEALYDAARAGGSGIPAYPTGDGAISFWASGRLPFMATFTTSIAGVNKTIRAIVLHAKSGSTSVADYNRRLYDFKVLKDTLDAYYAGDNIVIVGDYNEDIITATYNAMTSPCKIFYDDAGNYSTITSGFSAAAKVSYVGANQNMIDHHMLSNEMATFYVPNSAYVEDPRGYVSSYTSTTSDHLPVYSRYSLQVALPLVWQRFYGWLKGQDAQLNWQTSSETNSSHFVVERSANGSNFSAIGKVKAAGNSIAVQDYTFTDAALQPGVWHYRIRQMDADGKYSISKVVVVRVAANANAITLYPNPVQHTVTVTLPAGIKTAQWTLVNAEGKTVATGRGSGENMVRSLQTSIPVLATGFYVLQVQSNMGNKVIKLVKE